MQWVGRVNAQGVNFDTSVVVGNRFVSVNDSLLSSTFNSSAIVQVEGIRCTNFRNILRSAGYATSLNSVMAGSICNETTTPRCANITCGGNIVSFTVNSFSGYAVDEINLSATFGNSTPLNGTYFNASGHIFHSNKSNRSNVTLELQWQYI